jgi:predicted esterase
LTITIAEQRGERPRVRPHPLAVLAVLVIVVGVSGLVPAWPGLIQFVALPPLDLMADLRALLVYAPNAMVFAVALAAAICVRAAVLAYLLGGLDRERFLFAVRYYVLVLPFAAIAAVVLYSSQAVLFYGAYWAGLILTLAVFAAFGAVPWYGGQRLRTALGTAWRRGLRAGTLGAYLTGLLVVGAVAFAGGASASVIAVPASAALTWFAAEALHRDPGFRVVRRLVAVVPAAGVLALVAVMFASPDEAPGAEEPDDPRDGSIMLMSGIDSRSGVGAMLEVDPAVLRFTCEQTHYFSYAGSGPGQPQEDAACEIDHGEEYDAEDTMRSREELVGFLEEQTAQMEAPGVLVGHSQGVWLVWDAAVQERLPNIEHIVLVGPYPENEVAYPAADENGAGRVGRMIMGPIAYLARQTGQTEIDLDSPLGREWLGDADAIRETLAEPLPAGIDAISVPSFFDLPLMPEGPSIDGASDACPVPAPHPDLPYASQLVDAVNRFLDGEPQPTCPVWRHATAAFLRQFTAPASHG